MNLNPTIYKVDQSYRLLASVESVEEMLMVILKTYFGKNNWAFDKEKAKITSISIDNVSYYLHAFNTKEKVSDWREFLPNQLGEGIDFNQQKLSLILLAKVESDVFCIVGGSSYNAVLPFLDPSFGLNSYARLLDGENDKLQSIKTRGISGAVLGTSEQFRDDYRIIDFARFGSIPTEIIVELGRSTCEFYFTSLRRNPEDRIVIKAARGFQIRKRIDFDDLHNVLLDLESLKEREPSYALSPFKELTSRKLKEETFMGMLLDKIYKDIETVFGNRGFATLEKFEFDFCNPNNTEQFYAADEYRLREKTDNGGHVDFQSLTDRREIYPTVIRRAVELHGDSDFFKFKSYLQGVRVACYIEGNEKQVLASGFLFHFSSEFEYQDKPLFLVDTKWYQLHSPFVQDLKSRTKQLFDNYKAPSWILEKDWQLHFTKKEREYNLLYKDSERSIVCDTVIVDGIELCDLIRYDDENIYLVHVKRGFAASVRELSNQVVISAKRLRDDLASDKSMLRALHEKLSSRENIGQIPGLREFLELFEKNIKYVLAVTSPVTTEDGSIKPIDEFKSNIARFSVIQCSSDMRSHYYDLLLHQIPLV